MKRQVHRVKAIHADEVAGVFWPKRPANMRPVCMAKADQGAEPIRKSGTGSDGPDILATLSDLAELEDIAATRELSPAEQRDRAALETERERLLGPDDGPDDDDNCTDDDQYEPDDEPQEEMRKMTDTLAHLLKSALGREMIQKAASESVPTFGGTGNAGWRLECRPGLRADPLKPMTDRDNALLTMALSPLAALPLDEALAKCATPEHRDYGLSLLAALGGPDGATARVVKSAPRQAGRQMGESYGAFRERVSRALNGGAR
jgi:hypothetical protein